MRHNTLRFLLLAILPWMAATGGEAQTTAEQEPPDSGAVQARSSEAIIVTARKREENAQDVPMAVSVVTSDKLEEAAVADISELQTQIPNLAISQGRNQSSTLTVFVRGIGQVDPLWGVDPGVGLYFDDVYIARPQGALLDVFDVGRIEVLRGPQGTLYGKNTIGGAIKYVSKPLTDEFSGVVSISPGTQSNLDVRASISGALVPGKLRGKIAFAMLRHDGYGTNRFTGRAVSNRKTLAGRGAVDWLVHDTTRVQLSADYTNDTAEPKGYQRLAANPFCPALLGASCPPLDSRFDTQGGLEPLNSNTSKGGSLVLTSSIGPAWRLKSITAYRQSRSENNIDFDTTPARIADIIGTLFDRQWSQELQLNFVSAGRLTGVLGAYALEGEAGGLVKNIFLNSLFTTSGGKTLTGSMALFGDVTCRITKKANLNFGVRATREKKHGIAFNAAYKDDLFTSVTTVTASYDKSKTFDSVAPRIGIDYRFRDGVLGYFTWSRGYKSGGFNIRAQSTVFPKSAEPFNDEILDVAEIGVKSVFRDGQLVLNTAIFEGKYKDVQVSTYTAYDSNGDGVEDAFFGDFLNAGDATMRGAEIELDASIPAVPWLSVNGFGGWLDAKPDRFLDENHDGFVDTQVITNAPKLTGGLHLNIHVPLGGGLFTASAGGAYRGSAILTNEGGSYPGRPQTPLLPISQNAYASYDAWVNWLTPDARWRYGIAGKNLSDEHYLTSGYNVPALGILTGSYGAPRSVIATLEYRIDH